MTEPTNLTLIRRLTRGLARRAVKRSFWQEVLVRRLWRRPFWYTDKYGVAIRRYPEDELRLMFVERLHCDDEPVLVAAKNLLKPGMLVIDIGANYGQFSLFAVKLVGSGGFVHAFEPCSYSFKRLSENFDRLRRPAENVSLNQQAVGSGGGRAVLYEYPLKYSSWNSLSPCPVHGKSPVRSEDVPVITLDDYCAANKIERIDLLKIDVEGFELEVFKGCARLIGENRIQAVIFEISHEPLKGAGYEPKDVFRVVLEMGFDVSLIESDGKLIKVNSADFEAPYFANYLAAPSSNRQGIGVD